MSNQRLPLSERIRILNLNASVVRAYFDIWWIYAGVDTRSVHLRTMDLYSEFFRYDQRATQIALVLGISTLLDPTKKTITLRSVVNKAVAEGFVGAKHLIQTADQLQNDRRVVGTLHLRNKLFAHRDDGFSENDIFKQAGISADDLRGLVDEISDVATQVSKIVGVDPPARNTQVSRDTSAMLRALREHDQAKDESSG